MEPIQDYHQPFLEPLIDAPNSKYHLRDWLFKDSVELSTYIRDGLLPNVEGKPGISTGNQQNDSILVVLNMARGKATRNDNPGHMNSHYRILSFLNAIRHRRGLFSQGPIRMLLWLADKEKHALLPQTVSTRKKIAVQLETYFHVEEIVGGGSRGKQHRERALDLRSGQWVAERMKSSGIRIPLDRQDELQKEVEKIQFVSGSDESIESLVLARDWEQELDQLQKAFDKGEFSQIEGGPPGPKEVRMKNPDTPTPQFKRMRQLRFNARLGDRQQTILERLLKIETRVDSLQNELLHEDLDEADREAKLREQDRIRADLKATLANKEPAVNARFNFLGDDRRALNLDPPLLLWDRREAEPLVAEDEEFHNSHKLALLDFRPLVPMPCPMTDEEIIYFDHLSTHLLYNGIQTVKSLNSLAPGAFEALGPKVAALRDPLKGGRAYFEDLRARNLTPEMIYRLALAWQQWAFKTPVSQFMDRQAISDPFFDTNEGRSIGYSIRRE